MAAFAAFLSRKVARAQLLQSPGFLLTVTDSTFPNTPRASVNADGPSAQFSGILPIQTVLSDALSLVFRGLNSSSSSTTTSTAFRAYWPPVAPPTKLLTWGGSSSAVGTTPTFAAAVFELMHDSTRSNLELN